MRKMKRIMPLMLALIIIASCAFPTKTEAAKGIKLIVNGKDITELASPRIEDDRTLVPIRFISEELGANVIWDGINRTVTIDKDGNKFLLRIDSRLVEYDNGKFYEITDVPAKIINDRTFVPLRLVSNALDISIKWDNKNRQVIVDSTKPYEGDAGFDVNITSHTSGDIIQGKTKLQMTSSPTFAKLEGSAKYLLLDPNTGKGFVIGRGDQPLGSYEYIPGFKDNGNRVLVGAIYDKSGNFVAGDAIPVNVNIIPNVSLNGLSEGGVINGNTSLGSDVNFVASYVKYEFTNLDNGKVTLSGVNDPIAKYNWSPMFSDNGSFSVRAIAYDESDQSHSSTPKVVNISVERKLSLLGVKSGTTVNKAVTLLASRNFDVSDTEYLIRDVNSGVVTSLKQLPYGDYKWTPGPGDSGLKELWVRVVDSQGTVHESDPIRVTIDGSAKLSFEGIGPKQVVTGATKIKATSNVPVDSVTYILINNKTGARRVIASNQVPGAEYIYTPIKGDAGEVTIQAEANYGGKKIVSGKIAFKVYLGKTYGPMAVIEKPNFISMASKLAILSQDKTGMSAALQTAQAILETGWGQSVPVDKYSGVKSYNLFGIKGTGPAGSVVSNTWEVYDGVTYRVDAGFRAYKDLDTSWADHKEFLKKERYDNLRTVMHDPIQGAWALKTAGYATDPQYPIKLMKLIKDNNLLELDKVGI